MPTLPSGVTIAIGFPHIPKKLGNNWFSCPPNHFWYKRPDTNTSPPPYDGTNSIIENFVHAPVPTSIEEVKQYLYVMFRRPDGKFQWRGDWLSDFPQPGQLNEEDTCAWMEWLNSASALDYLKEAVAVCTHQAETNQCSTGVAIFQSTARPNNESPQKQCTGDTLNRFRGTLIGLACGDAIGAQVEGKRRGTFEPLREMTGGGKYRLAPGQWTDDTSMALCLATSLIETVGFDPRDQMDRYSKWLREGYLSSTGDCFDIGSTISRALREYRNTGIPFSGPTEPTSAGNGSLMRLAPVPMFFYRSFPDAIEMSGESSRTTHGATECIEACKLFGAMILLALSGKTKAEILLEHGIDSFESLAIEAIGAGAYLDKDAAQIDGSGYVVESLEAALWSFQRTENFRDAILTAANLGNDADTTAAICGQLAGAYYGISGIPKDWQERVAMRELILDLADQLHAKGTASDNLQKGISTVE